MVELLVDQMGVLWVVLTGRKMADLKVGCSVCLLVDQLGE